MIARLYVAGSYSAPTLEERRANVARARAVARAIVEAGGYAVCPHLLGEVCDDLHDWEWWMQATSRELESCDAVVVVYRSDESRGTAAEIAQANRDDQPVWHAGPGGELPERAKRWIAGFGEGVEA